MSLTLPILVQCLTVLPDPPQIQFWMIFKKYLINFLWNGKKDKIKRFIIITDDEEGGYLKCYKFNPENDMAS